MRRLILMSVVLVLAACASSKAPEEAAEPTTPGAASPAPPQTGAPPPRVPPPLPLNAAPQLAERLQRLDTVTCADLFVLNGDPKTGQPQLVALSLILLGYLAAQTGDYDLGADRVGYLGRLLRERCVEAPERTVLSIVSGV